MYSSAAFAYTSILYFMPVFLKSLSTTTAYAIILLQQACSVPGVMLGSWLVETRFGRRYTILFSFMLAAVCCFLFYIEANIISV
jgi:sugar phosphate permease